MYINDISGRLYLVLRRIVVIVLRTPYFVNTRPYHKLFGPDFPPDELLLQSTPYRGHGAGAKVKYG